MAKNIGIIVLIAFAIWNWELIAGLGILGLLFGIYVLFKAIF